MSDFNECLEFSHRASELDIWDEIYQKAFPDMVRVIDYKYDRTYQDAGIDKCILLCNPIIDKYVMIDEKVRKDNYGDILLEYMAVEERDVAGWVCKPSGADFIAYANLAKGMCYMLPVPLLQEAWRRHKDEWIESYKTIRNSSKTEKAGVWHGLCLAVPVDVLFQAMGQCLRVGFTPLKIKHKQLEQMNG